MHSSILLAALSAFALVQAQVGSIDGPVIPGTTGKLGDAAIVTNNPAGVTYTAFLPNSNTTGIRGYIAATSNANGTGVVFNVNLYGFPSEAEFGPFLYHIHAFPVPADGNCTATLGHLDPYERGEIPPCDSTQPATCQVGDLSGKHGNITTSPFQASYLDLYASTEMGIGAFLGNRSINVHTSNTTRLTCANFQLTSGAANATNGTGNGTVLSQSPSPTPFTGGAATVQIASFAAVAAGFLAFLL